MVRFIKHDIVWKNIKKVSLHGACQLSNSPEHGQNVNTCPRKESSSHSEVRKCSRGFRFVDHVLFL